MAILFATIASVKQIYHIAKGLTQTFDKVTLLYSVIW